MKMKLQEVGLSLVISLLPGHSWQRTKWVRSGRGSGSRAWQNQESPEGGWIPRNEERDTRVFPGLHMKWEPQGRARGTRGAGHDAVQWCLARSDYARVEDDITLFPLRCGLKEPRVQLEDIFPINSQPPFLFTLGPGSREWDSVALLGLPTRITRGFFCFMWPIPCRYRAPNYRTIQPPRSEAALVDGSSLCPVLHPTWRKVGCFSEQSARDMPSTHICPFVLTAQTLSHC